MKQILIALIFLYSCSSSKINKQQLQVYKPDDKALYDTIVKYDSIYFNAYNTCDMSLQERMYSDNIEFYHDNGGLTTSKKDLLESLRKYICGKVTRELVPGSIEVYPIKNYGAIEIGFHKFHNRAEQETTPPHAGRFVIIWQNRNNEWKMTRVVSLH